MFHGSSETTLTYNMAFLDILMHLFLKIYIAIMSGILFFVFVQSLFQFGAKEGNERLLGGEELSWHFLYCCKNPRNFYH